MAVEEASAAAWAWAWVVEVAFLAGLVVGSRGIVVVVVEVLELAVVVLRLAQRLGRGLLDRLGS